MRKEHKMLLHSLLKQHLSNRVVRRNVNRGIRHVGAAAKKWTRSAGFKRGLRNVGNNIQRSLTSAAISGMGDYHVGRGFHKGGAHLKHRQSFGHTGGHIEKGQMTISHSEYVGELISSGVTGAVNFTAQNYAINPGNSGTFPWLSSTAINFQDYKFKKLVFEYRPLVSESTSTSAVTLTSMGSVIMSTQYDSILGPYSNKPTAENSDFAISTKPSEHILHAVECNPRYNPLGVLYTSSNLSLTQGAAGSDIRMQNLGIFQIASSNIPVAASTAIDLGEIWVHYEVCLYKPQLNAGLSAIESAHYYGTVAAGSPTAASNFGPNVTTAVQPAAVANNSLPLVFTSNTFSFPLAITEGSFLCMYYLKGAPNTGNNISWVAPTVTAGTGTVLTVFNNGVLGTPQTSNYSPCPSNGIPSSTQVGFAFVVQVNAPGATLCTVTFGSITNPPTGGMWDLFVTPYNSVML